MSKKPQSDTSHKQAFAARLQRATEAHPQKIPDTGAGRHAWFVRKFKELFDEEIVPETVRKWFNGMTIPRPAIMAHLAEILDVDVAWLALGTTPNGNSRQRKLRGAVQDGAINIVAGLIQMDGGQPAFPRDDDTRAKDEEIDIYTIIKGAQYAIHVCDGRRNVDDTLVFSAPTSNSLLCIGVIRLDGFAFDLVELDAEAIGKGRRTGGTVEVTVTQNGDDYFSGDVGLRRITTFSERF